MAGLDRVVHGGDEGHSQGGGDGGKKAEAAEVLAQVTGGAGQGRWRLGTVMVLRDEAEPDDVVNGLGKGEEGDEPRRPDRVEPGGQGVGHGVGVEACGGGGEGAVNPVVDGAAHDRGGGSDIEDDGEGERSEAALALGHGQPEEEGDEVVEVGEDEDGVVGVGQADGQEQAGSDACGDTRTPGTRRKHGSAADRGATQRDFGFDQEGAAADGHDPVDGHGGEQGQDELDDPGLKLFRGADQKVADVAEDVRDTEDERSQQEEPQWLPCGECEGRDDVRAGEDAQARGAITEAGASEARLGGPAPELSPNQVCWSKDSFHADHPYHVVLPLTMGW